METIRLYTTLEEFRNEIAEVVRVFFPGAAVEPAPAEDCDLLHVHAERGGMTEEEVRWTPAGKSFRWQAPLAGDRWELKRRRKRSVKTACYLLLRGVTGYKPPWGSLTGIRPTRLFAERLAAGETPEEAERRMVNLFDTDPPRAALLAEILRTQEALPAPDPGAVDIYVGIPFCTTRCAYCSFFAEAVGKGRKVPGYLEALGREIGAVRGLVRDCGFTVRALYVGGGTPTALDAASLARLLETLGEAFPGAAEWTVEAGRPDTMDPERLRALRAAPVTRISVNPQTMNDATLRRIGRAHTAEQTREAFARARQAGPWQINMDVIAGLPGEDEADFAHTLEEVARMAPDCLTVHTLARKHGSKLNEFGFTPADAETARRMVDAGRETARALGMTPYYLYRQKYSAGNLENVGYAAPGKACLYNVDIMEETQSVIALGAGGISKRLFPGERRIERAPNVAEVDTYIRRLDEMIARKRALFAAREGI